VDAGAIALALFSQRCFVLFRAHEKGSNLDDGARFEGNGKAGPDKEASSRGIFWTGLASVGQVRLLRGVVALLCLIVALLLILIRHVRKSRPQRVIGSIVMKRKRIRLTRPDPYGHWWFEIGNPIDATSESYGWWPATPLADGWLVCISKTFWGVPGRLNAGAGGTPLRDPHHGDSADVMFRVAVDLNDPRPDAAIENCLRAFAMACAGTWRWFFGLGQNCHSFQRAALRHCRLKRL
jgi:hypothetical protein